MSVKKTSWQLTTSAYFRFFAAILSGHPLSVLGLMLINGVICFWLTFPDVNWTKVGVVTVASGLAYRWLNNIFAMRLWGFFFKFNQINMVVDKNSLDDLSKSRLVESAIFEHRRNKEIITARENQEKAIRKQAVVEHYDKLIRMNEKHWKREINNRLITANEKLKRELKKQGKYQGK